MPEDSPWGGPCIEDTFHPHHGFCSPDASPLWVRLGKTKPDASTSFTAGRYMIAQTPHARSSFNRSFRPTLYATSWWTPPADNF